LVRRTLSSIARDEKRHAALGADILRWCAARVCRRSRLPRSATAAS
jgi:hypothetical protein